MPRKHNTDAHLTRLPAELRNRILLDIATPAPVPSSPTDQAIINIANPDPAHKALIRSFAINKQLFAELRKLFYSNNHFIFTAEPAALKIESYISHRCERGCMGPAAKRACIMKHTKHVNFHLVRADRILYGLNTNGELKSMKILDVSVRPLLRNVTITITAPFNEPGRDDNVFAGGRFGWLYPLRAFKELGFKDVRSFDIHVFCSKICDVLNVRGRGRC